VYQPKAAEAKEARRLKELDDANTNTNALVSVSVSEDVKKTE